jgi:hypothetical protein
MQAPLQGLSPRQAGDRSRRQSSEAVMATREDEISEAAAQFFLEFLAGRAAIQASRPPLTGTPVDDDRPWLIRLVRIPDGPSD